MTTKVASYDMRPEVAEQVRSLGPHWLDARITPSEAAAPARLKVWR
jgi:hypothetical protein